MSFYLLPNIFPLVLGENSACVRSFQLLDALDGLPEDITGDAFQLTCRLVNVTQPDLSVTTRTWELAGAVVTAASGIWSLTFSPVQTGAPPATYEGELLWWASGTTTEVPKERWTGPIVITGRIDNP